MPVGASGGTKEDFSPAIKSVRCGFLTSQLWHLVGIISGLNLAFEEFLLISDPVTNNAYYVNVFSL